MIPTGISPEPSPLATSSSSSKSGYGIGGSLSDNPWTKTPGDTTWPYTMPSMTDSGASLSTAPPSDQQSQNAAQPSPTTPAAAGKGISHGALAAAIVVPILAALAVLILVLVLLRRRRRSRQQQHHQSTSSSLSPTTYDEKTDNRNPPVMTSSSINAYNTGLDTSHPASTSSAPPPPYLISNLAIPASASARRNSQSAASITSTLYSDAASIRSAREARMSVGAADMVSHSRSASSSLNSDPFKTGNHSENSSRHGSVDNHHAQPNQARRSSEIVPSPPQRGRDENERRWKEKDMS